MANNNYTKEDLLNLMKDVKNTFTDINAAIVDRGGENSKDGWSLSGAVSTIPKGNIGGLDTNIIENGQYTFKASDYGYDGLDFVWLNINVPGGVSYPEGLSGNGIEIDTTAEGFSYDALNQYLQDHPEIKYVGNSGATITDSITFSTDSELDSSCVWLVNAIDYSESTGKSIKFGSIDWGNYFTKSGFNDLTESVNNLKAAGWEIVVWDKYGVILPEEEPGYVDLLEYLVAAGWVDEGGSGDSYSYFDGGVDKNFMKEYCGWTDDDIADFNGNAQLYTNDNLGVEPNYEKEFEILTKEYHPQGSQISAAGDFIYTINSCTEEDKLYYVPKFDSLVEGFNGQVFEGQDVNDTYYYFIDSHIYGDHGYGYKYIKGVPSFDTSSRPHFKHLFTGLESLLVAPRLNTSNGTSFINMFDGCSNLRAIPKYNTSNGTSFAGMFQNCKNLTSIPQLDTSNGTNFYWMFYGCTMLRTVPTLDTHNGTDFTSMFDGCTNLTSIQGIDWSSVSGTPFAPFGLYQATKPTSLSHLIVNGSINTDINFGRMGKLDFESYKSILTAARNSNNGGHVMTFYSTSHSNIPDQDGQLASLKADCENMGWTISGLTLA